MEWRFESARQIDPGMLRREVMAELRHAGTPDSDFGSAELILGELIGNAIRHARGKILVRLDWDGDYPALMVHDEHERFVQCFDLPSDPLAESGRGLYIVKALAKDFRLTEDDTAGGTARAVLPVRRATAPD